MNKLYQQLQPQEGASLNNLNRIKQMMQMFKNSNNPQQLLTNMVSQNPQMKNVMQLVNNSGKNPKDLFYAMAKQRGVKFGRPAKEAPDNFVEIVNLYKKQKITVMTAIEMSGLTRGTFYRKLKNCVF